MQETGEKCQVVCIKNPSHNFKILHKVVMPLITIANWARMVIFRNKIESAIKGEFESR